MGGVGGSPGNPRLVDLNFEARLFQPLTKRRFFGELEETGLEVVIHQTRIPRRAADAAHLVMPETLLLEDIAEDHQHIDFIYFAGPRDAEAANRIGDAGQDGEFYWVDERGLEDETIPETVRSLGRDAIARLSETEGP